MTSTPHHRSIPREIWVLIGAAFLIAVGYGLIAPVLPQFARAFSVSVTATTVVVSAFSAFRLAWAAPAGGLVTRWGERPTYMVGVLVVAASSAATAFAQNYWQLLVFRSLGGIGSVMFTVSAMGLLVKLAPPLIRARVSALYAATFLVGSIAGPILGGLLAGFGMRVPFLTYAGFLVLAAALVGTQLRAAAARTDAPPRPAGPGGGPQALADPPAGAPQPQAAPAPLRLRTAVLDPSYRAVLAGGFANGWNNFGMRIAMVPLFALTLTTEAWVAGAALAVFAIGNAAVLPLSSRIADTVGRRPVIRAGLLLNGVFTVTLGFSTDLFALFAFSLLAGAGAGMFNPGQQAAVADIIGHRRSGGQVLATFQMVQDVGAIVGPIVAGLIADTLSYSASFGLAGAVVLLGALPWLRAPETLGRNVG